MAKVEVSEGCDGIASEHDVIGTGTLCAASWPVQRCGDVAAWKDFDTFAVGPVINSIDKCPYWTFETFDAFRRSKNVGVCKHGICWGFAV